MPSPFPGMDPYLEGEWWQEFHQILAGVIRGQLVPQLPDRYVALLAKHCVLSVEIREVGERRLVTLIEILSPFNKRGEGAREYGDRRLDLLQTAVHLLEIDLLRAGTRIAFNEPVPPAPYYVYLSRAERRPYTQVWAIGLRDHLPIVPVPLLAPDPDVTLDLQAALTSAFDLAHYERLLDYQSPPPPPELDPADAAWVRATVQAAGR